MMLELNEPLAEVFGSIHLDVEVPFQFTLFAPPVLATTGQLVSDPTHIS